MKEPIYSPEFVEENQENGIERLVEEKCFEGLNERMTGMIQEIAEDRLTNHWLRDNNALVALFHSRAECENANPDYYANFFASRYQPGLPDKVDPKLEKWTYFEESIARAFLAK